MTSSGIREKGGGRFPELVDLVGYGDCLPRGFSGDMKQRVALVQVLVLSPLLLLMDEPIGALDAQTRKKMQEQFLYQHRQLRQTILFITHDIQEAVTLADRVLFLDRHAGLIREELTIPLDRLRDRSPESFHKCSARLHDWLRRTHCQSSPPSTLSSTVEP